MSKKDKKIDDYIAKAQPFAQPILKHIRQLVHKACPDVEETWKWSFPNFDCHGGPLCSMAAFKQHCAFAFWKASLLKDANKILATKGRESMGHLGKIKGLKDLLSDKIMIVYLKEAAKLNEQGIKVVRKPVSKEKKEIVVPDYFLKAIAKNKKALKTFGAFSYSHKKEYVEWITEAKSDATRESRMKTAMEWLSEGKPRMWKYIKK
jgi:uncharacterized protein YdeI (YjbR/CyaY-like superfamily)